MDLDKLKTEIPLGVCTKCSNSILTAYRGSIAHGMYVPPETPDSIDDIDIISVIVPPIDYYFGLSQYGSRGTNDFFEGKWDCVIYELKKFISLLVKGNPNVLTMLWLKPEFYIQKYEEGQILIDNRHVFLSKMIYHSFSGYANGQLSRMTNISSTRNLGAKRKKLVERYGYDCKNAAHCIRLLRMASEFFETKEFNTYRDSDREELLDIKQGKWRVDEVQLEAGRLFDLVKKNFEKCDLPDNPDKEVVNSLCISILSKLHFPEVNLAKIKYVHNT